MSREIKFRVWNSAQGEYRRLSSNNDNGRGLGISLDCEDGIGSTTAYLTSSIGDSVEQFTGLKDKNGRNIYEGDLLKFTYPFNSNDEIGLVEWSDKDAGFVLGISTLWKIAVKAEVIGNVHTDGDLIDS